MTVSQDIRQQPHPDTQMLCFCGDTVVFRLDAPANGPGTAWVRTNIGQGETVRREIIAAVEDDQAPLGRDWFDLPMRRKRGNRFEIRLGLAEIGHFEAKCFFLPKDGMEPLWPPGGNVTINVSSADACCANTIYNAFVRQFGPNRSGGFFDEDTRSRMQSLDGRQFTVIPPSGTFRDLARDLDFIIGTLGCRMIQLLPINPTPTTYGRMGRFGSPYASLGFTAVDPSLAEFDPRATPLEQFSELVDAVHARSAKLLLDIAINHTGWAAGLHEAHPEWLVRDPDGRIETPGAWGVVWADLTKLDYRRRDLWRYMGDVFLRWCRRGVDGFRCDAAYMIPIDAWRYIIAKVRESFPDTVFLLEGLGGKISVTRDLLDRGNFDYAYSELFQNYDRGQIEGYLPEPLAMSSEGGLTVHFAETHDNDRLAARSHRWARMRTALCALTAPCGAWGFANGVEWLATEKIDVHGSPSLNWGAETNQVAEIRRLNLLMKQHPAFHDRTDIRMIQQGEGNALAVLRHHRPTGKRVLAAVNLDPDSVQPLSWRPADAGFGGDDWVDLLTGRPVRTETGSGRSGLHLEPGAVMCLSDEPFEIIEDERNSSLAPPRILHQRLRAKVLEIHRSAAGTPDVRDFDVDGAARRLRSDPPAYLEQMRGADGSAGTVLWQWPTDARREVMVPPGWFVMVRSPVPIRAAVEDDGRVLASADGFPGDDGGFSAVIVLPDTARDRPIRTLRVTAFEPAGVRHCDVPLRCLPDAAASMVRTRFHRSEVKKSSRLMLSANGRGGTLRARLCWGEVESRYDALLAGNPDPRWPVNRRIMFTRCRGWVVYQGFSQDLTVDCLEDFQLGETGAGFWRFRALTGQGSFVDITVGLEMVPGRDTIRMTVVRSPAGGRGGFLEDHRPVRLILRPDIEDRDFHDVTKAYAGPEQAWRSCVRAFPQGFRFAADTRRELEIGLSGGVFVSEPEWHYMVYRSADAERGLDPDSDLFSPGYFEAALSGGDTAELYADIGTGGNDPFPRYVAAAAPAAAPEPESGRQPLGDVLERALNSYIVKRGEGLTVIAGYPWFLDWGRDSMIFVRCLIEMGRLAEAESILGQFGRFESGGTLPNMIAGGQAANRDTSDGPLWFVTACGELAAAGGKQLLERPFGDRTMREVVLSIGRSYLRGTENGIRVDLPTGLVFSPAHFTWMDTNHPAGSPREGYPIEIQALWHAALRFLAKIDTGGPWTGLARQVRASSVRLFPIEGAAWLSDCRHGGPGTGAESARPDDALRPNQLFAVTLGLMGDDGIRRRMVDACAELIVPGGVRSLADRGVSRPLEIRHGGAVLGDPFRPYRGRYTGDEDTSRKPAYHNGTAWTWLLPVFCEAYAAAYGDAGRPAATAWLLSAAALLEDGCIGQVPEILDGDSPHAQRGCDAQAWGVSELLRVYRKLGGK